MKPKRLDDTTSFISWWNDASDWYCKYREAADKAYRYYEGEQWTSDEKRALQEVGQSPIVINHIKGKVNYVVGIASQQEIRLRAAPRGNSDSDLALVASILLDYINRVNDWRTSELFAFKDSVITGLGWLECRVSQYLTKDPIHVGFVDYREMMVDPYSYSPTFDDCRYMFRFRWVDEEEAIQLFPEAKTAISESYSVGFGGGYFNPDRGYLPGSLREHWWDRKRRRVLLVECIYRNFEDVPVFWDGVRAQEFIPKFHRAALQLGKGTLLRMRIPRVRVAFFVGDWLLEDIPTPYSHGNFWYIPLVSYRDRNGIPFGIVKDLIDPQDEVNKRRSKALFYLLSNRVIAEQGAIDDPDDFMDRMHEADAFLEYRRGYNIKIEKDLQLGQQHFVLMQEAGREMQAISGVYPDAYGMPTNARTGAAIQLRTINSQASLADIFSNRVLALKRLGEIELALAKQLYSQTYIARIVDSHPELFSASLVPVQTDLQTVLERNDLATLDADITVEVAPGRSERQAALTQYVEVLKALPPEATLLLLEPIIDLSDAPYKEQLRERLNQVINLLLSKGGQNEQPTK